MGPCKLTVCTLLCTQSVNIAHVTSLLGPPSLFFFAFQSFALDSGEDVSEKSTRSFEHCRRRFLSLEFGRGRGSGHKGEQGGINCGIGSPRKYFIFLAHSAHTTFSRQKVTYFNISRQNFPHFWKIIVIITL